MARHADTTQSGEEIFCILAVCTGNICRSPQVEHLLRDRLPSALPGADPTAIEFASAGTQAVVDAPIEPQAAAEAARLGVESTDEHRARQLEATQIERADLVIALAAEHRGNIVRLLPAANHRTFTLIELTRVVEALAEGGRVQPPEPLGDDGVAAFLQRVVEAAAAARGLLPIAATKDIDVPDPYGRSDKLYRRSADAVAEHVDRLVAAIGALARR
ncbi:low molecular weight phosphatase family protein [Agrococcus sp. Ld7]|uniref:arsenate reductase/protein-tyrosine-phosphatase family protein n=1 Tax=Agrococcus sp. Ld7 TaxID=649148 RepID=UPI0038684442